MAFLLLISVCTGCGGKNAEEVTVDSVSNICGMGGSGLVDRFAGIVSPQGETKVKKTGEGDVKELLVSVGDKVKEGDVLFTYDTEQISLQIQSAQLEISKCNNEISAKKSDKAEIKEAMKSASDDEKLDATYQIQAIDGEIRELNSQIASANNEIANLRKQMDNASVKSPSEGHIQSINEDGGYDEMGNELPFITIVKDNGYRIKGYVNEANVSSLSEGMDVIVRSRVSDETWKGTISMIDLDNPSQSENYYGDSDTAMSSKYPFYVELTDGEGLMMGQHVYIEPDFGQIEQADPNQINLPSYYIVDIDDNPYVWAQNNHGKLEKRSITLGDYNEELDTYVVTDGLNPDDYIAFPDETLSEGMHCISAADFSEDEAAIDGELSYDSEAVG